MRSWLRGQFAHFCCCARLRRTSSPCTHTVSSHPVLATESTASPILRSPLGSARERLHRIRPKAQGCIATAGTIRAIHKCVTWHPGTGLDISRLALTAALPNHRWELHSVR